MAVIPGLKISDLLFGIGASAMTHQSSQDLPSCQGTDSLVINLHLAGQPCNVYGEDIEKVVLKVEYQGASRIHVMIYDEEEDVYQVPESVLSRPGPDIGSNSTEPILKFEYKSTPFAFSIRRDNDEFHQCGYGYRDVFDVAEVVYNYSQANIQLETMWTDIDYMDRRSVFTLDPHRFPVDKMRELIDYLHDRNQHYIVMVDPAVDYSDNGAFERGMEQDVFLKLNNGSIYKGVVWPGETAYPDWFHPNTQEYWNNEFELFFNPDTGIDVDALGIDMNEAANFCDWPCEDTDAWVRSNDLPPDPPAMRPNPRPLPGFPPDFQPYISKRVNRIKQRDPELLKPQYEIHNAAGALSNQTIATDLTHANGLSQFDAHNLYGTTHLQEQEHMLATGAADEQLCARWAMLGAFYPFFCNHNEIEMPRQEFYVWGSVADAARKAIETRYNLIDYIYTAFYYQTQTGKPVLNPLFYLYPEDENTFAIDLQFFYGDAILVSPVTTENATSVEAYLPKDIFYDYYTGAKILGKGQNVRINNVPLTHIPLHIRGGTVVPMRFRSANNTTGLREQTLNILIAPGLHGDASGSLYLDDGESLEQECATEIDFDYNGK
ncbi:Glycosyl hydrolases family 31 protein [Coccidioides posadasii C735 delta SOWgp]|uniref:Glycosyl hydrolases family 31 protein n=1 Tax=Coccidioides posadasii (strain C735) TaxID=222929 RepID=C5P8C1_COCP7|nr:Glycosyl hydrolases family 31 protein [Coccidioides posadasii C735 delta SOWgp]EER26892.1 Glycosyl hydrolases family 31 protein [Coccidioides posadasii C735 delta SOWgp]|eukprot:XP_003069037.1 Glycosyl hydrolases family 31 protein [Coccidioides posadasii C735 delta SOWgp]